MKLKGTGSYIGTYENKTADILKYCAKMMGEWTDKWKIKGVKTEVSKNVKNLPILALINPKMIFLQFFQFYDTSQVFDY